ncbi:MAG: UrcA family protein [Halioglobus sp.]|jgi:UrcA family protein
MKNVTKTICAVVFGITAGMSGMAMAGSTNETVVTTSAEGFRTATVSYADLDLNNASARKSLHYRISSAAEKVCGSVNRSSAGSLAQTSKNRSCYNNAMDQAMRSLSDGQATVVSR